MKYFFCILLFICSSILLYAQKVGESHPDTVTVGAYIISVHDINFHEKEYTARFWLWFLHENADFDFSKQLDIPNAKSIQFEDPILDSLDGKVWVIMKMKCTMKENWNVTDFPFDKQHLKILIENALFDHTRLVFKPDLKGSQYDIEDAIDGWKISNFKVSQKENDYQTGFGDRRPGKESSIFSQFAIEMDLERAAWGLFMKIFIGMYIAFFIAAISFVPHPSELEPRFGLPVGGLFAAVGNKYIIDSLLPESSSFSLVDTLHTITFTSIFATLVVSAIALKFHDIGRKETALNVNKYGSRIVLSLFVILNIVSILIALR